MSIDNYAKITDIEIYVKKVLKNLLPEVARKKLLDVNILTFFGKASISVSINCICV
jgi:hypothetical protein